MTAEGRRSNERIHVVGDDGGWCQTCGHELGWHKHAEACRYQACECAEYRDAAEELVKLIDQRVKTASEQVRRELTVFCHQLLVDVYRVEEEVQARARLEGFGPDDDDIDRDDHGGEGEPPATEGEEVSDRS
jgi:hypothetical protein